VAATVGYVVQATPAYRATAEVFVAASAQRGLGEALEGSQFTQAQVKSYARIVSTPLVTGPVIDELGLNSTPSQLATKIEATVVPDTVLIEISATDNSADRAAHIANALARVFARRLPELDAQVSAPIKATTVSKAEVPTTPVSPRPALDIALAAVLGILLGVLVAAAREALDTTVRRPEETEDLLGIPTLGGVNFDSTAKSEPIATGLSPQSVRAEAFRYLRTNLQFLSVDTQRKVVVFTSAVAGEGKSTTVLNLGVALSRGGADVVVVDGDLRRPSVARYMQLGLGAAGLTDVLVHRASMESAIVRDPQTGLGLVASGPVPPNPNELLASETMSAVLDELQDRFEWVLIDAPPVLPVSDAVVLASKVDGVVLVVRSGKTRSDQLLRTAERLRVAGATLLGTVMNMQRSGVAAAGDYDSTYYSSSRASYDSGADTDRAIQSTEAGSGVGKRN
jgi:capsular exopolysaccharide synthesis family protein